MAYLKELPKCCVCQGRASVELMNHLNSGCGFYCQRCGRRMLRELERKEKEEASR